MQRWFERILYLIVITILMIPVPLAFAIETDPVLSENTTETGFLEYETESPTEFPSLKAATFKMAVCLVIVLLLMIGVLLLIKKYMPDGMPMRDQKLKLVRVIERVPIAPKQSIYLLWVIDRVLVVSHNQGTMTTLSEIKDQNVLQNAIPDEFTDILNKENLDLAEAYNNV